VVVGAEVVVTGPFVKPEAVAGPYAIVALEGADFGPLAVADDRDLVALDLSASGILALPEGVFLGCLQLAAVAFPREVTSIGKRCFGSCDVLRLVDLSATALKTLGEWVFIGCGAARVSIPASLREIGDGCFTGLCLNILDLRACAGVIVKPVAFCKLTELLLPREGFADAAKVFLPCSCVEVLEADIDDEEMKDLQGHLEAWGIDKLEFVSPGQTARELSGVPPQGALVPLTDVVLLSAAATVTMTTWWQIPKEQWKYLRSLDLSGLVSDSLPAEATLRGEA
jgi:hypothetical protein